MLHLDLEVNTSFDVSNANDIRRCNAPINMDENDALHTFFLTQLRLFFKDMITGNNAKIEDDFIDSGSEPVHCMNLNSVKKYKTSKKGRIEFM